MSFRTTKNKVKTAKGRKISSTNWIRRHINDPYVQLANLHNYRARSAFKLIEINDKYSILSKSNSIIDLGCAPGSWLQAIRRRAPKGAKIIGIDLKPVDEIKGIHILKGDFCNLSMQQQIQQYLQGKAETIISDMAPNACGDQSIDHLRIVNLVEEALLFCEDTLEYGGSFIAKMLQGSSYKYLVANLKQHFNTVHTYKPNASYSGSTEIFLICLDFHTQK